MPTAQLASHRGVQGLGSLTTRQLPLLSNWGGWVRGETDLACEIPVELLICVHGTCRAAWPMMTVHATPEQLAEQDPDENKYSAELNQVLVRGMGQGMGQTCPLSQDSS